MERQRRGVTIDVRVPPGESGLYTRDYPGFEMLIEDLRATLDNQRVKRGAREVRMLDRWGRVVAKVNRNGTVTYGSRSALAGTPPR